VIESNVVSKFTLIPRALKKRERVKRLRALYEKIKKQIREKYKFCNLYVKNLPDTFDEDQLRQLFSKYGDIKSCKSCKKDLTPSMIGVKRSVKVYGFVCFADPTQAREAKTSLHNQSVFKHLGKLFVDYFQSKKEREEYLKLKMINNNQKAIQKGQFVESPFPQMISQFGPGAGCNRILI
jgi:polyadenylate-binding protein